MVRSSLPQPLVDAPWLLEHLEAENLRVADCRWYLDEPARGRVEYERGHIPGAVYVSLDDVLSASSGPGRHPLPSPHEYARRFAELGFGDEHRIVMYDTAGGAIAARMWWMLRGIGHDAVAVLNGGLAAWEAAGGPTCGGVERHRAAQLTVRRSPDTIDGAALTARLGAFTLIDARAPERYRGEHEPIDPVAGHIPTAINLPYAGNLTPDGRFRPVDELRAHYEGVAGGAVVYCGSGVTACHGLLAMEAAGLPPATLYPGSWSDWCASGRAVATGPEPGTR